MTLPKGNPQDRQGMEELHDNRFQQKQMYHSRLPPWQHALACVSAVCLPSSQTHTQSAAPNVKTGSHDNRRSNEDARMTYHHIQNMLAELPKSLDTPTLQCRTHGSQLGTALSEGASSAAHIASKVHTEHAPIIRPVPLGAYLLP